ncbi:radical SAM protein [Candidatus Woesearchaeota archaeon]|nr:radical SAM protein [Candidatus Woesearchaeota archaeon]
MINIIEKIQKTLNNRNIPTSPKSISENIYFFGDFKELDDRISGKKGNLAGQEKKEGLQGSELTFAEKAELVKKKLKDNERFIITIGVSRYNFFRLREIAEYCCSLQGKEPDMSWIKFDVYPVAEITERFKNYFTDIKEQLPENIRLNIYDKDLYNLLDRVKEMALSNALPEDQIVRLFSVICEHAFIGPQVMVVDPHHKCNTNCSHCWIHTPKLKDTQPEWFRELKFPFDRFKRLVDDAAKLKVETMILQGDGEPLLYDKCMDMLRYIAKKGIHPRFFTNGILLTKNIAEEVIKIGVKEIYCSFPAGTPETYKIINSMQKPETYNKVVKNLKTLMDLKKKYKVNDPHVIVTHVIHNQNYHELVKMAQDDVYEGVDSARFYLIRLDTMNQFLALNDEQKKEIQRQIPIVEKTLKRGGVKFIDNIKFQLENFSSEDGSWCKDVFLNKGCPIGYYFNLVFAKGDVSFCCHLRFVGDVSKDNYMDIWKSDDYRRWRIQGKHMKHNMDALFLNNAPMFDEHCTHCDNHQNILGTFKLLEQFDLMKYY